MGSRCSSMDGVLSSFSRITTDEVEPTFLARRIDGLGNRSAPGDRQHARCADADEFDPPSRNAGTGAARPGRARDDDHERFSVRGLESNGWRVPGLDALSGPGGGFHLPQLRNALRGLPPDRADAGPDGPVDT